MELIFLPVRWAKVGRIIQKLTAFSAQDAVRADHRRTRTAALLGLLIATAAIVLRLTVPASVAGEQSIFSFPAIMTATLLFGVRAGSVTATICGLALWYFVLPQRHSFLIKSPSAVISMIVYLVAAATLIWAIGEMRIALARYRTLTKNLEQLVENRTAERNRLWERSTELLAIVNRDGTISAANPALTGLLQKHAREAVTIQEWLLEEDRPIFERARDTLQDDTAAAFEARIASHDGIAWIDWSMVRDADQYYLIGRDFTIEHALAERLSQSQKMKVIGQMVGGLAHDFGNLLPPISMTLHLLEKRHGDDPRTGTLIAAANESVDRAGKLIRRLLTLSRPSRVESETRAVAPLLEQITPLLRQSIGNRTLEVRIDASLPAIRIDANQLDMALLNLALNARDATAENGHLTLSAGQVDGGRVAIRFSDDGTGMDAETLRLAIDPFFSTKPSGEGSGLGLPMVHNFAVTAGGSMFVESMPGEGTKVTILLPGVDPSPPENSGKD